MIKVTRTAPLRILGFVLFCVGTFLALDAGPAMLVVVGVALMNLEG